ncbi:L-glutamine:scyllo-inosose aminotransferase [Rosistilla carotiformis]|uniref:L-glutamine:scyllo-inosose aminotransferase n=1 Tax=Rosistilla carotiformis TaxID=2528017 RepID=A0A518JRL3_9BACT|nr:aminotransferase class I/II-fold pyridoxal phosphate-dependent enzyme [Rosistilla carotiformis]QDV68179.1 L-glutamine:scyllo-inosose aminotransferase [Rosistilla carotiformis]
MPHVASTDSLPLPNWPPATAAIADSIRDVVQSGDWGSYTAQAAKLLASQLASAFQVEHVRLCGSGTAAIELALQAVQVRPESEVILAGYDYPGNIRAIESVGGKPVIVDTQPGRWVIDVDQVENAINDSTSAILASHLYGNLFDAERLRAIADTHRIALIEDACQVHGASLAGRPAGSWGDVGILSFGGSKLMTSGSGGAMLMSDDRIAQRATLAAERPSPVAPLCGLQAAALLPQLSTLPAWNAQRRVAVGRLKDRLRPSRLWRFAEETPGEAETTYFKVAWFLPPAVDREAVIAAGLAAGIPLGPGFNGFLRRARRRYRTLGELRESGICGERSVVMDHRVLLANAEVIDCVAERLLAIENAIGVTVDG